VASRSKLAFILPDELCDLLTELRASLGLSIVLQHKREPHELWDGRRDRVLTATRVFLAEATTVNAGALADPDSPARLGWVMVDVPRVDGGQLFSIQAATRGDWFEKTTGAVHENKDALKRFDKVWKDGFASRLGFPMVARNVISGAEAAYSSIGYSAGAAEWWRGGGRLRQRGVDNLEFIIPQPGVPKA